MINLEAFNTWMVNEGLATSTRAQRMIDARQIIEACSKVHGTAPMRLHFAARSFAEWANEAGVDLSGLEPGLGLLLSPEARKAATGGSRKRKKAARAFTPTDWKRLALAIAHTESREARVLEVVLMTGLRIGDVLGIERAQVERAVRDGAVRLIQKGGEERELYTRDRTQIAFARLLDTWTALGPGAHDVAGWIVPESNDPRPHFAAYQRCSRALKTLAEGLGLDGVVHLHRMRRTVAMQALAATRDIGAVQQLLGHKSAATTQRYLDEERPEDVARLQKQIQDAFLGKE